MATISKAFSIALEHHRAGRFQAAEQVCRQILQADPQHGNTWHLLGVIAYQVGNHPAAVDCIQRAVKTNPAVPEYHCNLANALQSLGELERAAASYRHALTLKPGFVQAYNNLGNTLKSLGQLEDAVGCYRQALAGNPGFELAHNNLGVALKDQGLLEEALACYRQALALKPDFVAAHTNLLNALHYRAGVTLTELADAHAEFERRHAAPLRAIWQPHQQSRDPNRRLRVGFVSSDLGNHPVGYFLIRALEHLDRQQAEIVCYSERGVDDELTARFQAVATRWRKVVGWNDQRLADQIREDQIDILVDLAGHTGGNRLFLFARKPAPIQITWLGYEGTTGLSAMDFILADRHEIPDEAERHYVEKVLRMPDGYVCFDPPAECPPVRELPALATGHVTFGSFNNPAKFNSEVVRVWSMILQRVPGSRLRLKYRGLSDVGTQTRFREMFAAHGMDVARVEFEGKSTRLEYLDAYNGVDIALDPFPFCGGITTCEALWMGVPVITSPSETFASRHSLSHLSNIGLTESIARNSDEYVEIAVQLANDLDRLAAMRSRLRQQVADSPLCDGAQFATHLMDSLRAAWRTWTERSTETRSEAVPSKPSSASTSGSQANSAAMAAAVAHHQAGRLQEAEEAYRQILQADPQQADAWHLLGVIAAQKGNHPAAVERIGRAVTMNPSSPDYHNNLGNSLTALGRLDDAVASFRNALARRPEFAEAHNNLGNALKGRGDFDEAVAAYRRALAIKPGYAEALNNLGNGLKELHQWDEAERCLHQAIALRPEYAEAHCNLGNTLREQEKLDEAIACYRQALAIKPVYADVFNNLGNALKEQAKLDEAVASFRQAISLKPGSAEAHCNLGNALKEQGKLDEAVASLRQALALKPDFVDAHSSLGNALKDHGKLDDAVACYRQALALDRHSATALNNLAVVLKDQGRLSEAIAAYRQAIRSDPTFVKAHSNLLYALCFSPDYDAAMIRDEHRTWNEQHALPLASHIRPHTTDRSPDRRLRVGYVSPDFRAHVVGFNLLPLFREHDRRQFEILCYSNTHREDVVTDQFRGFADVFRNVASLNNEQLARQIEQDRIDILVDLTLHMANNRLLVFARKPAPVQLTFAGYPGTTGLTAIDARLTDRYLDPPGCHDDDYSEKSLRLPDSFWCYDPPNDEPSVNALPALDRGYVTFGCLNNFCKVNLGVLQLWSRILIACENSRLILLAAEGSHREEAFIQLEREGIARDRITFAAHQPRRQYLELYHQIDLGLDTVPYNGHTTSLDSFWMGIPVITLVGKTVVGRAGLSQLTNLGLPELIAESPDDFVRIATELARNLPLLSQLRGSLRERMRNSPLMDAPRFARNVETAYRTAWQQWC